jgi:hypothetical protein
VYFCQVQPEAGSSNRSRGVLRTVRVLSSSWGSFGPFERSPSDSSSFEFELSPSDSSRGVLRTVRVLSSSSRESSRRLRRLRPEAVEIALRAEMGREKFELRVRVRVREESWRTVRVLSSSSRGVLRTVRVESSSSSSRGVLADSSSFEFEFERSPGGQFELSPSDSSS